MAKTNRKLIDLTGQVFGRLTVLREGARQGKYTRMWVCLCTCGRTTTTRHWSLTSGTTKSCGCMHKEVISAIFKTHGMSKTPEYHIWEAIKSRCFQNTAQSADYRDRGITMCNNFAQFFSAFFAAVGSRPHPKHTIDRIDNNGNYSCGKCEQCVSNGWLLNVRWAPWSVQSRNKRSNRYITINGERLTITDWAHKKGLSVSAIYHRLYRGYSEERAVNDPLDMSKSHRSNPIIRS